MKSVSERKYSFRLSIVAIDHTLWLDGSNLGLFVTFFLGRVENI